MRDSNTDISLKTIQVGCRSAANNILLGMSETGEFAPFSRSLVNFASSIPALQHTQTFLMYCRYSHES